MKKFRHLTIDDRRSVEQGLKERLSFKQLAKRLECHPSTIAREVMERSTESNKGAYGRVTNRCIHRYQCSKVQLCADRLDCLRKCALCRQCNSVCSNFEEELCVKLREPPYVCNGCPNECRCTLRKIYYVAKAADKNARQLLVETRRGANITEEEKLRITSILAPGIRKGQSVYHILTTHADDLTISAETIYRYIASGIIGIRDGDLPRKVYLKPRKTKHKLTHKVDSKCRINRTIEDYHTFCETEGPFPRILMDTVIGRVGGKVLLTLHFCDSNFMIARLLPNKTSAAVIEAFDHLTKQLGQDLFAQIFPVILTDNGTEFSNPTKLETCDDGTPRTRIFYCDAYNSNQKAEIERNHEFLRLYLPKRTSFDNLQQSDIDLILSHINSYARPKFLNKTPIDLFTAHYSPEILNRLNQTPIPPDEICLKPDLLKRS